MYSLHDSREDEELIEQTCRGCYMSHERDIVGIGYLAIQVWWGPNTPGKNRMLNGFSWWAEQSGGFSTRYHDR